MPENKKEAKKDCFADFKEGSIDKASEQGEIYPTLTPELDKVYNATIKSEPKAITTKLGDAWSLDMDIDGMTMSMIIPSSFRFHLAVICKREGLTPKALIGKDIAFVKSVGKHKTYGETEMYNVQLRK